MAIAQAFSPDKLPTSVRQLCPGLYAVGGSVPLDPLPIWMPESARGWLPMMCYVFRDDDHFVLVDSGTAAVRKEVMEGVRALAQGAKDRRTIMTRRELDCSMNLPQIIPAIDITMVECASDINPLEFFESFDEVNTEALVKVTTAATLSDYRMVRPGDMIEAGSFKFEIVRPPIRVLSGSWVYEHTTRTMLSSDVWGFVTSDKRTGPIAVKPNDNEISVERIRDFTGVKFDCFYGVDTSPIIKGVVQAMAAHPSDRICPSYGAVIEGRGAVATVVENTVTALEQLGAAPRPSAMTNFSVELRPSLGT